MSKILSFLAGLIGVKALKIIIIGAYYAFIMSFYVFVISSIVQFYNLIHSFFDLVGTSSSTSDVDLSKFFGLLHCVGFTDALLSSLPTIVSSIVFLLTRYLWVTARQIKSDYVDKALRLI